MARTPRIAMVLSATDIYSHRISAGIGECADAHGPRDFYLHVGRPPSLHPIAGWPADGVITSIVCGGFDRVLAGRRIPAVAITNRRPDGPLPRAIVDDEAVGRLAAEHLIQRGLTHFAYLGHADAEHGGSASRGRAFAEAVARDGGRCQQRRASQGGRRTWDAAQQKLAEWLQRLRHPVGVFAYTDHEAWPIVQACRHVGLAVPDDVAVLGTTDDPLVTRLANPPLSSVSLPLEKLGYEAAGMLDRLLGGAKPPACPVRVAPEGVVERRSTEVLAIDDPDLATAPRYIRANAHRPLRIDGICDRIAVSKRTLQRKAREVLGRTLSEEIRHARIGRAKSLLRQVHVPIAEVARRCGFRYLHHFCRVFRNETGRTPSDYRAGYRLGG